MNPLYIIDLIGYFGPQTLFGSSIYLLYNKSNYLFFYIIGFIINIIVNFILKEIVKQPRPKGDYNIFNPSESHKSRFLSGIYGMPSGHAQHVLYSTIFIYLVFKNTNLTLVYALISLLTLYERVKYKNHTIIQVIVGAVVGALIAYYSYNCATKKIVGKLLSKQDDNAKDVL